MCSPLGRSTGVPIENWHGSDRCFVSTEKLSFKSSQEQIIRICLDFKNVLEVGCSGCSKLKCDRERLQHRVCLSFYFLCHSAFKIKHWKITQVRQFSDCSTAVFSHICLWISCTTIRNCLTWVIFHCLFTSVRLTRSTETVSQIAQNRTAEENIWGLWGLFLNALFLSTFTN